MHKQRKMQIPLHLMVFPGLVLVIIFSYGPMVGLIISFQDFKLTKGLFGSELVGFDNFRYIFGLPGFINALWNTVWIAFLKMIAGLFAPIATSLLLNEMRKVLFKRAVQTIIYLPHFLSWVILAGILLDILSPSKGIVNSFIEWLGLERIYFLGDATWFPWTLVISDVWKEFGFSTIVYLAVLTSINPALYEAAVVDGAGRWKQTLYITLPGMLPIIILMSTLSLGQILNAGFDQVFNLYSPIVYETGDIIDTFVYRVGLVDMQFDLATAVGFFKSIVSLMFISVSYYMAYRFANYRIF